MAAASEGGFAAAARWGAGRRERQRSASLLYESLELAPGWRRSLQCARLGARLGARLVNRGIPSCSPTGDHQS